MKHRILIFISILSIFTFSCKKDKDNSTEPIDNCTYLANGKVLTNPYGVQKIATDANIKNLEPSHFYVKTFVKNSEEFNIINQNGEFLPFDWRKEPNKNLSHETESNSDGVWMYGIVSKDKIQQISNYEVLENSYYPEKGDGIFEKMYTSNSNAKSTSATINGKVEFYDPIDKSYHPLKNITVIIKDAGKMIEGTTNENGDFNIDKKIYSDKVEVMLKFDSKDMEIRALDLKNLGLILAPSVYTVGMMGNCALDQLDIQVGPGTKNNELYNCSAGFYAYQQFREFSAANGYGIPDGKLNFWIAKDASLSSGYAAPMLRHVGADQGAKELLMNLFGIPANLAGSLANLIKKDLPDIYAPYYSTDSSRTSPGHIETLFHEFGHSTQFTRSGKDFWGIYIKHIFENGGYGDGNGTAPSIVAMSESWAEDFSFELLSKVYGSDKYTPEIRDKNKWSGYPWIPVGLYYDLLDDNKNESYDNVSGFTFPELYQIFGPDVKSPQQFRDQLFIKYPEKAESQREAIINLFTYYGYW
jgi:hypothetical protein